MAFMREISRVTLGEGEQRLTMQLSRFNIFFVNEISQ